MKKILFLLFVLYLFIGDFDSRTVVASASTDVSGIIREDTVWTKENSPYNLVGDIQIANGVTLKIEPGTVINGNNKKIYDLGILEMIGDSNSRIKINNTHIVPANNDYSKKFLIHIEYADLTSGSLYAPGSGAIYGSLILKDSKVMNASGYMYIWYPKSNVYIERNVFMNSRKISVGTSGNTKVYIRNNVFYNSLDHAIENWASYDSSETIVEHNSFLGFGNKLVLPNGYSNAKMTAVNNYWGTVDETSIGQRILDKNDDLRAGSVIEFKPYLSEPDSNTPIIDVTAPEKPRVNEITEKSSFITGTAEERSTVSFFLQLNNQNYSLGKITADDYGNFKFPINPLAPNSVISVAAADDWSNSSESTYVTVKDVTAPVLSGVTDTTIEAGQSFDPKRNVTAMDKVDGDVTNSIAITGAVNTNKVGVYSLIYSVKDRSGNESKLLRHITVKDTIKPVISSINEITDQSTEASGYTEPYINVEIFDAAGMLLGKRQSGINGYFSIPINRLKTNQLVYLRATDQAGNIGDKVATVVFDRTAPTITNVEEVGDYSMEVRGDAEIGATIELYNSSNSLIGKTRVNESGKFIIPISQQVKGTLLYLTALDDSNNRSERRPIEVLDRTAPFLGDLTEISDHSTHMAGRTEPNSFIKLTDNTNQIIAEGYADRSGNFTLLFDKPRVGIILNLSSTDAVGNVSEIVKIEVLDRTAPVITAVNEVSDQSTTVSGITEAGVTLIIKKNGEEIARGEADEKGNFNLVIAKQIANERLTLTAIDGSNNESERKVVTVIDKTAPEAPQVDEISDGSIMITGQTEANATVIIMSGRTEKWRTVTGEDGRFSMEIEQLNADTTLEFTAVDESGNISSITEVIVKDRTAPAQPDVDEVSDRSTIVTGMTEKNAKVILRKNEDELVRTTADATGQFKLTVLKQTAGTELSLIVQDESGNTSTPLSIFVIDKTAPVQPTIEPMTNLLDIVQGKAEAGSTVTVKNESVLLGQAIAEEDGMYSVFIGKQRADTVLIVTSMDHAGNISQEVETKVLDRKAPVAPIVEEVTDQSTLIKGFAEGRSVVTVKVGTTELAKGTADEDDAFTLVIPKQQAGTLLTIISTDVAGNISPAVSMLVADKTAPTLQVNQITNRSVLITGITEPKAKVQLTYATKTMEATADATGKFSFTITAPKTNEEFSFTASDSPGNKSDVLKMKVTDATLPVLQGATDVTIEAGTLFDTKRNVTATDETDGDLTKSILIAGAVDSKKPGLYSLTYSVKDRAGNEAKMIRRVTVKDTIKPLLSGVTNQSINLNSTFDPKKGITAKDNIDGDVTKSIQVSGSVNLKKIGTYTLTYKVADRSGNTTTLIREITVKDNVKPVITGAKSKTIKYKSSFNPMTGVTAKDNVDGSLTKAIKVTGSVNSKRKGVYALTYTVKDKAGNSTSMKIKITVR